MDDLGATCVRLVVRRYNGDARHHRYRLVHVDDPAFRYLVPVCQEFPYPWRHPREMVGGRDLPEPGSLFDSCAACDAWASRHRHSVLVRGQVFA